MHSFAQFLYKIIKILFFKKEAWICNIWEESKSGYYLFLLLMELFVYI